MLRLYKICLCSRSTHKIPLVRHFWSGKKSSHEEESCSTQDKEPASKCQEVDAKLPDSWSQPKVVIIGAGIAGLSAAQKLAQYGICDVTVLEAADKPGGRIQSCWFTSGVVELGASTIRGACVANSVYNLAVTEHILQPPVSRQGPHKGLFYTRCGKPVDTALAHKAYATFRQIESMAISMFGKEISKEDSNMGAFMRSHIKKEIMNFQQTERQCALTVMNAYLASLQEKTGVGLDCVNTKFYGSLSPLPGGDIKIPVGFVGVLAPLIRDIPDKFIKCSKPVENVQWDLCQTEKPRATVRCADGEEFPADYVLITTSLGFLKNKAESFFVPNLPQKKINLIRKLGFGHLDSLFLQFPEPMWLKDEGDIMFAWHPDDYAKTDSWVKGLTSLAITDESGRILSGVVSGKEAIAMEALDADQVMTDIQKHMQKFLGNPCIPKPLSILRSKWSSDVFTQGAITYISTGSELDDIKDMGEPVPDPCHSDPPLLFFAGEHTCPKSYATVHGARNSGIREANRIISYTNKFKGAPSLQKTNVHD